jgi:hypothetical protein
VFGGLNDIKGSYDTLQEAKAAIRKLDHAIDCPAYDYSEIVDRDTWEIVFDD